MRFIRHLLFAVTLVFAGAAFALDLDSAKSQGLVGEQPDARVPLLARVDVVRHHNVGVQLSVTLAQVNVLARSALLQVRDLRRAR